MMDSKMNVYVDKDCDFELRIEMMKEGWSSRDRLIPSIFRPTDMLREEDMIYTIWFYRSDWHKDFDIEYEVYYYAHRKGTDKILEAVKEASELARRAWKEFRDIPPIQMADGSLKSRYNDPVEF